MNLINILAFLIRSSVKLYSLGLLVKVQFEEAPEDLSQTDLYHYAVVVDAGSSGSRVIAFKFKTAASADLQVVDECNHKIEPGLSAYADDPKKGAQTVVSLINKCDGLVPAEKKHNTPVVVRATAGLRQLPKMKSIHIIRHVRLAITPLGYKLAPDAVKIMSGAEEGIYTWYAVNLMRNSNNYTLTTLELGSGSSQITFQVNKTATEKLPDTHLFPVSFKNSKVTLFSLSYLGLGIKAAKLGALRLEARDNRTTQFHSICFGPDVQLTFTHDNIEYHISGLPISERARFTRYDLCNRLLRIFLMRNMDVRLQTLLLENISAVSNFYTIASKTGILDVKNGGYVTVSNYRDRAMEACSASDPEHPWDCFELLYAKALLQDGYRISDNTPILLLNKVDRYFMSWTLGIAHATVLDNISKTTDRSTN